MRPAERKSGSLISRRLALAGAAAAVHSFVLAQNSRAADGPMLPNGAPSSAGDRRAAVDRGMRFLHQQSQVPANFTKLGDDYLWCFYSIGASAADPVLRAQALDMGRECAHRWWREHAEVPAAATPDQIHALVCGALTCDLLGVPWPGMQEKIKTAAARFGVIDYLRFDPVKQAPPDNLPLPCQACTGPSSTEADNCDACARGETNYNRYDLMTDALIRAFFGESYGVRMGCNLDDVIRRLGDLRPYPRFTRGDDQQFIYVAYCITHIVYVLNDYGQYRMDPNLLPQEFAFLKEHLPLLITADDAETMGEFIDTLKSFGMTSDDPLISTGMAFIQKSQNRDGSWGQDDPKDIYPVFHSTWTGVNGLMDYAFKPDLPAMLVRARAALKA